MQNPHAGLQSSLCSGSATFPPTLHIVPCQPDGKVSLSLNPFQASPLPCLCFCFSDQLESTCYLLNRVNSSSELPLSFILYGT